MNRFLNVTNLKLHILFGSIILCFLIAMSREKHKSIKKHESFTAFVDSVRVTAFFSGFNGEYKFNFEIKNFSITPIFIDTTIFLMNLYDNPGTNKYKIVNIHQSDEDFHTKRAIIAFKNNQEFKKSFDILNFADKFDFTLLYINRECQAYPYYYDEYTKGKGHSLCG